MIREILDDAELAAIFEQRVKPRLDARIVRSPRPTLVMVGGQPGSGKTDSLMVARRKHREAVPIMGDDLRRFHPNYRELMANDPLRMPDVTAQAAGAWVGMALDHVRAARASILMESTLRNSTVVAETLGAFHDDGYRISGTSPSPSVEP